MRWERPLRMLEPRVFEGMRADLVLGLLALAALIAILARLHHLRGLTAPRIVLATASCAYAAAVVHQTFLPFEVYVGETRAHLASWRVFVNLVPLVTAAQDPIGIILNVFLFVPFGILCALGARRPSLVLVATRGLLASLLIETVQLLADVTISSGRVADVDDLIGNTVGAVLGYAVFRLACTLPPMHRLASATRWPVTPTRPARASHEVEAQPIP